MSTQTFNNGETGLSIRNKINSVFAWNPSFIYNFNDVTHVSGSLYSSLINNNIGIVPISSSSWRLSSDTSSFAYSASYALITHTALVSTASYLNGNAFITSQTVSSSYSILNTDGIIYASASASNIILTLPVVSDVSGQFFRIKKIDSTGYEIIISSSVNIDYDTELRLNQRGSSVTLHSNSTQYWIH